MSETKHGPIGIYIDGAKMIENIQAAVMAVLAAPHCDEATKQAALAVLREKLNQPMSVSGCTINMAVPAPARRRQR